MISNTDMKTGSNKIINKSEAKSRSAVANPDYITSR